MHFFQDDAVAVSQVLKSVHWCFSKSGKRVSPEFYEKLGITKCLICSKQKVLVAAKKLDLGTGSKIENHNKMQSVDSKSKKIKSTSSLELGIKHCGTTENDKQFLSVSVPLMPGCKVSARPGLVTMNDVSSSSLLTSVSSDIISFFPIHLHAGPTTFCISTSCHKRQ